MCFHWFRPCGKKIESKSVSIKSGEGPGDNKKNIDPDTVIPKEFLGHLSVELRGVVVSFFTLHVLSNENEKE